MSTTKKKISVSLDPRSSLGFSWWSQMAVEKGTIQHGCCILSCNIFFKSVDIYRFPCLQWCQKKKKQQLKKKDNNNPNKQTCSFSYPNRINYSFSNIHMLSNYSLLSRSYVKKQTNKQVLHITFCSSYLI